MAEVYRSRVALAPAEVYRSDIIGASIDRVWETVRDFNSLPIWTSFVSDSRIERGDPSDRVGCIRNFYLVDGGNIREQLLNLDDENWSVTYSILESPMPLTDYRATLTLYPVYDSDQTFAEWSASFDCPLSEKMGLCSKIGDEVFAEGLLGLKKRFGG